jgi:hypothetical protein
MKYILSLLLLSLSCFAQESDFNFAADISIDKARTSLILEGVIYEFKFHKMDIENNRLIFQWLQDINTNTIHLNHNELNQFLMAEMFKLTLSTGLIKKTKNQITTAIISSSKEKLNNNNNRYSVFAKYFINEFINDYKPYLQDGTLKMYYQNKLESDYKRTKLKKLLKYSTGWIMSFNNMSVIKFNDLARRHIFVYLRNISEKSKIFVNNSQTKTKKFNALFQFKNLQKYQNAFNSDKNLNQQNNIKMNPADAVKDLKIDIQDTASEKIDDLIRKIEENP